MHKWTSGQTENTLINGLTGDPGLYTFFAKSGDAVLFDLGDINELNHRLLLKTRVICVSHTHIDHFIGFDRLLRINIPHFRELIFCGPVGLAANVQGKLRGYLWNLVEVDQLKFQVHEIHVDGKITSFALSNNDCFELRPTKIKPDFGPVGQRPLPQAPACCVLALSDGTRIEAVALDHGTPSIAYLCQSPLRFVVKQDELARLSLEPGPWIKELQVAVAELRYDAVITAGGKNWRCGDLASEILTYSAPRTLGYVTDIIFSESNLRRLKDLMQDVETLVCETNFRDADRAKAFDKKHLTTKQASLIAAHIKAENLQPFHISKIYKEDTETHLREIADFREAFSALSEEELEQEIRKELSGS